MAEVPPGFPRSIPKFWWEVVARACSDLKHRPSLAGSGGTVLVIGMAAGLSYWLTSDDQRSGVWLGAACTGVALIVWAALVFSWRVLKTPPLLESEHAAKFAEEFRRVEAKQRGLEAKLASLESQAERDRETLRQFLRVGRSMLPGGVVGALVANLHGTSFHDWLAEVRDFLEDRYPEDVGPFAPQPIARSSAGTVLRWSEIRQDDLPELLVHLSAVIRAVKG